MPWFQMPDGGWAHVKMARGRRHPCFFCERTATLQCDYPVTPTKTCDTWTCRSCAERVGPDRDYCMEHARQTVIAL